MAEVEAVGSVKTMWRVNGVPPIAPLMFASGTSDGIEDAEPAIDVVLAIRPVAATEYPSAVPLIDLMVGLMPVVPVHVIVAVARPRGILVRRATRAPIDVEASATIVVPTTIVAAVRVNIVFLTPVIRKV